MGHLHSRCSNVSSCSSSSRGLSGPQLSHLNIWYCSGQSRFLDRTGIEIRQQVLFLEIADQIHPTTSLYVPSSASFFDENLFVSIENPLELFLNKFFGFLFFITSVLGIQLLYCFHASFSVTLLFWVFLRFYWKIGCKRILYGDEVTIDDLFNRAQN